ncbi:MAG: type II toxin-antitoxin system VapC family toxin [Candidatus Korarchaeota archaeon]|nr:type II toxin-antitoxin system VapC family toxin [Candidatus Korarchaeota archaeon]
MRMIVDASSIIRAVKEGRMRRLAGESTIPLARFEVGNAIWKDIRLRGLYSAEDGARLLEVILGLVDLMEVVEPDYSLALRLVVERRTTFYDASYVALHHLPGPHRQSGGCADTEEGRGSSQRIWTAPVQLV